MADQTNLTCGNCGRVIGWMHTPSQIKEYVVCMECHERLAQSQFIGISATPSPANPLRFSKPPKALRGIFWTGLILWLAVLLDMTGVLPHLGVVFSLLWLGTILCAGSLALWAIIISAAPVSANPVRFSKPPKALRGVFWIGLILWLAALLDMTGGLPHLLGIFSLLSIPRITYSNVTLGVLSHLSVFSLLWLGAILCAGSLALWAIIVAWETYYKMHWHTS